MGGIFSNSSFLNVKKAHIQVSMRKFQVSESLLLVSAVCLKQIGAGKFSGKTNKIQEQLTSLDSSFINKAVGGNIQSLPLPDELDEGTSRSLSCSQFHITRLQGALKTSPSESTKGAGLYKYWPPLFTD